MIKGRQTVTVWAFGLGLLGAASLAAGQQPAAPSAPQAPAARQTTTATAAPRVTQYVVGQAKPPVPAGTALRDMTLDEAVQIALENNLGLQAAKMNPQIQDYSLQQSRAAFRPTLSASFNQRHSATVSTSTLDGVSKVINQTQSYSTSLSQNLPFYGANYSVTFNSGRSSNNQITNIRPIQFSGSTQFSYSQPLLANFKIDNARNSIRTQQVNREVADIQLEQTIEDTKASVRTAYWALRRSIESVEIQQESLNLAQRLLDDNRTKVEIGTMAPIDVVTNESTVATDQQALLNARIGWQTAELNLKQLLVKGTDDDLYKATINPTTLPPVLTQVPVNIQSAVQTALQDRTDLQVSRKDLESSAFTVELRKNNTMPSLNLLTSYQLSGTGGSVFDRSGVLTQPSGYSDVLKGIANFNQPQWTVGLTFSYPLGMASSKALLAQAQLSYQQGQANLKAQELSVSTDVTNAGLAVQNTYQQLLAARTAREAGERNAEAEQTRFDAGMSNNYNVATALNTLTSARLNELNAEIAYVNAIAEFDRKQHVGG